MLHPHLRIKNWLEREEGQDLAEYALLIGLIALVAVAGVTLIGEGVSSILGEIASEIQGW